MRKINDVFHSDILRRNEIEAFLDYYDGLFEDLEEYHENHDDESWDLTRDVLDEYDADAIAELRKMVNDSRDDSWVSETYWEAYAAEYADEMYGLDRTGAGAYFDYERSAEDWRANYTEYTYDGVSYYATD